MTAVTILAIAADVGFLAFLIHRTITARRRP